jgi:hypothetical protein
MIRFPADPFGMPETVSPKNPCPDEDFSAIGRRNSGLIGRISQAPAPKGMKIEGRPQGRPFSLVR